MRGTPTVSASSGTNYYHFYRNSAEDSFNTIIGTSLRSKSAFLRSDDAHISGTAGQAGGIHSTSNSKFSFDAEL